MNLRQVEAFQALMETQSVTKAGKLLFISQPAVSRLIADFEEAVGFKLFERRKGRLYPTAEAKLLHKEVEKAFIGLKQLEKRAESIKSLEAGSIRIVAMPGIAISFIPEVVATFSMKYPDINIFLDSRPNKEVIEWAETSFYDIAIINLPVDRPDIKLRSVFRVDLSCIMPIDHPLKKKKIIDLADLEGESYISYPSDTRIRFEIDHYFEEANVKRRLKIETRSTEAIVNLVEAGVGISIIPIFSNKIKNNPQLVYRPCSADFHTELGIMLPNEKSVSIPTLRFVDIFKAMSNELFPQNLTV
ncbi:MAG: LysR family transcriptional regulator [Deltaproteobacteria bacterium]|jgi:DNA-binding transcriptional LysR family regulator|nr:LysR family transcriptional regulator [Deltaproteobacteria bacterium]MBT4642942.1 LysR family transcriptional regulator [Deltaproteobacteria bacterium]MBT6498970.1 LysR family transcriptional regulator [Deltaproteobacteria bacterium]MBT6615567.1 LysR family transcriptional regulator [Deltaproteobacteria bacterium]MBT7155488.1 LysR family transcriptional regulator [Deltaproteobacteria bacterium]